MCWLRFKWQYLLPAPSPVHSLAPIWRNNNRNRASFVSVEASVGRLFNFVHRWQLLSEIFIHSPLNVRSSTFPSDYSGRNDPQRHLELAVCSNLFTDGSTQTLPFYNWQIRWNGCGIGLSGSHHSIDVRLEAVYWTGGSKWPLRDENLLIGCFQSGRLVLTASLAARNSKNGLHLTHCSRTRKTINLLPSAGLFTLNDIRASQLHHFDLMI
jgi:hypothetical protein